MKHTQQRRRHAAQGLVEYALILALVAVSVIVILSALGSSVGNVFSQVKMALGGSAASAPNPNQLTISNVSNSTYTLTFIVKDSDGNTVPASISANLVGTHSPGGRGMTCSSSQCQHNPNYVQIYLNDQITVSASYNGKTGTTTYTAPTGNP